MIYPFIVIKYSVPLDIFITRFYCIYLLIRHDITILFHAFREATDGQISGSVCLRSPIGTIYNIVEQQQLSWSVANFLRGRPDSAIPLSGTAAQVYSSAAITSATGLITIDGVDIEFAPDMEGEFDDQTTSLDACEYQQFYELINYI